MSIWFHCHCDHPASPTRSLDNRTYPNGGNALLIVHSCPESTQMAGLTMSNLRNYCERSSVHGLAELNGSRLGGRIFWATFLMVFGGLAAFQTIELVLNYSKQNTGTQTSTMLPDTLPNVLICPLDWVSHSRRPLPLLLMPSSCDVHEQRSRNIGA